MMGEAVMVLVPGSVCGTEAVMRPTAVVPGEAGMRLPAGVAGREISGEDFTAKDFRTWAGTVLAAMALQGFETFDSETQGKRHVVQVIEAVAKRLGNTPAICRKCYVHPAVIEAYLDGTLAQVFKGRTEQELTGSLATLQPEETTVLAFLRQRLLRQSQA